MGRARVIVVGGIERSAAEVCREHGVSRQAYQQRVARGWDEVEAATTPPQDAPESRRTPHAREAGDARCGPRHPLREVTDGRDRSLVMAALDNGIQRQTFIQRRLAGWPASMAAILPPGEVGVWRDGARSAGGRDGARLAPWSAAREITDGRDVTLARAASANGVGTRTLATRLLAGWPVAMAAILPPSTANVRAGLDRIVLIERHDPTP